MKLGGLLRTISLSLTCVSTRLAQIQENRTRSHNCECQCATLYVISGEHGLEDSIRDSILCWKMCSSVSPRVEIDRVAPLSASAGSQAVHSAAQYTSITHSQLPEAHRILEQARTSAHDDQHTVLPRGRDVFRKNRQRFGRIELDELRRQIPAIWSVLRVLRSDSERP